MEKIYAYYPVLQSPPAGWGAQVLDETPISRDSNLRQRKNVGCRNKNVGENVPLAFRWQFRWMPIFFAKSAVIFALL